MYPSIIRSRLLRHRETPIQIGQFRKDATLPRWIGTVRDVPGFSLQRRHGGWYYLHVPKRMPSVRTMAAELMQDPGSPRDMTLDLTALLLSRGVSQSRWGGTYFNPLDEDVLHLLTCGIDWSRYTAPGAAKWAEMKDTFDEGDSYLDVLGTTLYCRCPRDGNRTYAARWLYGVQLGFEMPSIAELIVALSSDQLERLFGE